MATNSLGQTGQQTRSQNNSYQLGRIATLVRDAIAVSTVGILLLCVHDLAQPFHRGFFCDDETIRYPRHESTVSSGLCYALGSGVNIVLILLIEYRMTSKQAEAYYGNTTYEFPIKLYAHRVYYRILVWLFGAISSELFTDISKVTAGRLRPHFIAVCQPEILEGNERVTLNQYCSTPESLYKYITKYECTGETARLRDIRLSFMSGHSSYSAYSAVHAVFYLQSTLDVDEVGLIKHATQLLLAIGAFFTALTRVSDYKHHWQDVLTGLIQGTLVATLVSLFLWPAYEKSQQRHTKYNNHQRVSTSERGDELNRVSY